jgi:hypothetical protein
MVLNGTTVVGVEVGSEAEAMGVAPYSEIIAVADQPVGGDRFRMNMLLKNSARPMPVTFAAQDGKHKAAEVITRHVRRAVDAKQSMEYDVTFGEGNIGLEVEKLVVVSLRPDMQAAKMPAGTIEPYSKVVRVDKLAPENDVQMAMMIEVLPRPLTVRFRKPDVRQNNAALVITRLLRTVGQCHSLFEVTFHDGPIGLEVEKLCVMGYTDKRGQAARQGVPLFSFVHQIGSYKPTNDVEMAFAIGSHKRPLTMTFRAPTKIMHAAAKRLQVAMMRNYACKYGVMVDALFDEGAFGLEINRLNVMKVHPGEQADRKGVQVGHRVMAVGGKRPNNDLEMAMFFRMSRRPLTVRFAQFTKEGRILKFSSGFGRKRKWKQKDITVANYR